MKIKEELQQYVTKLGTAFKGIIVRNGNQYIVYDDRVTMPFNLMEHEMAKHCIPEYLATQGMQGDVKPNDTDSLESHDFDMDTVGYLIYRVLERGTDGMIIQRDTYSNGLTPARPVATINRNEFLTELKWLSDKEGRETAFNADEYFIVIMGGNHDRDDIEYASRGDVKYQVNKEIYLQYLAYKDDEMTTEKEYLELCDLIKNFEAQ